MAKSSIDILINAQNKASKQLDEVTGSLKALQTQSSKTEAAAKQAAEKKQEEDDGIGFGQIFGAITRTANRYGLSDIAKMTSDADATADDVADIADELGISEEDVERCRKL